MERGGRAEDWERRTLKRMIKLGFFLLCSLGELLDDRSGLLTYDSLMLSVRLWPTRQPLSQSLALYGRSKAGISKIVKWKVKNFSTFREGQEREYVMQKTYNYDADFTAKLLLFIKGRDVCVRPHSQFLGVLFFETILIQTSNKTQEVCWNVGKYVRSNIKSHYVPFIQLQKLTNNPQTFLSNDTLTICFKFTDYIFYSVCIAEEIGEGDVSFIPRLFSSLPQTQDRSTSPPPSTQTHESSVGDHNSSTQDKSVETIGAYDHLQSLSDHFASLFDKETVSDFTLNVGSESVLVHRSVLCARSPVFEAMLTSSMLEASQNSVNVPDFSADSVRRLVRFMYSGVVPDLDRKNALELYEVSDKYGVLELRALCSRVMISELCVGTVCNVLALSDAHADAVLKEKALKFIRKRHQEVLRSPEWISFKCSDPLLALEVYSTDRLIFNDDP